MNERSIWRLAQSTVGNWMDDNAMRLSAALAFYTVWSIGPLFLVVVSVVGLVYGRDAAEGHVVDSLRELVGDEGANSIQEAIVHANASGHTITANVVGIVLLLVAASGVVAELKSSLNLIWEIKPPKTTWLAALRERALSLTMLLGVGFLLLVSSLFNAGLSAIGKRLNGYIPGGEEIWHVAHASVSFGLATVVFTFIFKIIPDVAIRWRDVWLGGALTAALFTLGQVFMGLYVGKTNIGSVYGAASSLMIVLVWIFFSSCLLFLGAEFTRAYARMYGDPPTTRR